MSSRYAPPPRDRSPPRYDRRPSATYPSAGSSYRGAADPAQPSVDRAPPRGPKADTFRGGFQFTPPGRGRGTGTFPVRTTDNWDRDRDRDRDRDTRAASQSYRGRDDDRSDWARRDRDPPPADRGGGPVRDARPAGRDRSASPIRSRRDSRESLPSTFARPADSASSYYGPAARGGLGRGRGRGDWDRTRGRNSFAGDRDRDLFANRSRSREGWRERDFDRVRPPPGDGERGDRFDRRDIDRARESDARGRDHDVWPRDHSPSRSSVGQSQGAARAVTPTTSASATAPNYGTSERSSKLDYDSSRRTTTALTPSNAVARDSRRDGEQADYFPSRTEPPRRETGPTSYQQAPTQPLAAAGGLDYGPPPSAPSAPAVVVEKGPPTKPQPPKTESAVPPTIPFQPPSGPKAERNAAVTSTSSQPPKTPQQHDQWAKADLPRISRPLQGPGSSTLVPDNAFRPTEPKSEIKATVASGTDKALPANIPSGPRSSLVLGYKPRLPSTEPISGAMLPTAPRESLKPPTMSDNRPLAIPTGPRLDRDGSWSAGGNINKSWISQDYSRAKPSIMNPLIRERPVFAPTAPRQQTMFQSHQEKPRIFQPSTAGTIVPRLMPDSMAAKRASPEHLRPSYQGQKSPTGMSQDVEMSLPVSSDDEADEDEFDEDDFAASEEKYLRERRTLEGRKPPPLLQDAAIRTLLIRIQFLNMLLHDVIPKPADVNEILSDKSKGADTPQIGLPSPEHMSDEPDDKSRLEHPQPRGRPLKEAPVNPIPTPPIDDLPYLATEERKYVTFDESEDEVQHEAVTMLIRQDFEQAAWEWRDVVEDMRADFKRKYPLWKQEVMQVDNERRELLQPSPAPASPAPSAAPSVTPSLGHERTRGARNTTEADLQAAILMSQQSLKEEEERREREAASSSLPNYETEAVVPTMLKPTDTEMFDFEDTNKLISPEFALEVFAYIPPEDDFDEDEQIAFVTAYCQSPKKWGKIAEALPGRSYQECITHYYLTKNTAHYKEIFRRSQPKRKRGRAATKPRSTALMSELVYGEDGEAGTVAVTDTGRPRRAAAPTFGDTSVDSEMATPVPQSKRLAVGLKDSSAEPTGPKPGRGRKAGTISKPRRTKAQIQADQQAAMLLPLNPHDASPQKTGGVPRSDRARTILRAENGAPKTEVLALGDTSRMMDMDMQQYVAMDPSAHSVLSTNSAAASVTSYWSVPEQQKFPQLISYYGRDFVSIAEFMKTKSVIMIKNYYTRQINDGKSELEDMAKAAERRRDNGEAMGTPPSPAAQTKRRYEATPSTASLQRHPILQPDQTLADPEHRAAQKSGYTEDFPSNTVQRSASGDLVAKPRQIREVMREAQAVASSQQKIEDAQRTDRPSVYSQKPVHGPRSGFFKEENMSFHSPHQHMRAPLHEQSPHQHPQRSVEIRSEMAHQLPSGSPPATMIGLPRDAAAAAQHQAQIIAAQSQQLDKYSQQSGYRPSHSRNGSLGMGAHSALEQAQDLASLRRLEIQPRHSMYGTGAAQSPTHMPAQAAGSSRPDPPPSSASAPPQSEPLRPPQAKRSNIMSILNDDPPEPQTNKRLSFEGPKRSSLISPQPALLEHSRSQTRDEMPNMLGRGMRGPYGPTGPQPGREYPSGFSGSPAPAVAQTNDPWMDRYDPRQQSQTGEQRALHQSPGPSHYSVVPPSTQPSTLSAIQGIRMEPHRSTDSNSNDHRRSILGQMNHRGHHPSPPPQQSQPSVQPYRSLSGSSHHGRVSSIGYPHSQSLNQPASQIHQQQSQQSQQSQSSGPSSHPQSTSSTPVSSLHHRSQPSSDYQHQHPQHQQQQQSQHQPRLTIQQYKAQQQQQQQQHEREREHEHEQALQRQREMENVHVRQTMRDHEERRRMRDIYAPQDSPRQQPLQQQQSSHMTSLGGGGRHMAPYVPQSQQQEPPRTYTPPYGTGPGSIGPNGPHASSGHHHHHSQRQQPLQQQQQNPGQPLQPTHHPSMHYRGLSHGQGQQQPEQQQGPSQGHGDERR